MQVHFEHGSQTEPRGHAVVYLRDQADEAKVVATYIIVLPIAIDVAKYMPPFLSAQIGPIQDHDFSAFAFPPVPEEVNGSDSLITLALNRNDDVIFAGTYDLSQTQGLMELTAEIVRLYTTAYNNFIKNHSLSKTISTDEPSGPAVNEILYEFMGERDRLAELTKLVGKLSFAVEGKDPGQIKEVQEEVSILSKYLPERFAVGKIVSAASLQTTPGTALAHLYLERCYKLIDEDYSSLKEIEHQIQSLEDGAGFDFRSL